jgi:hypothetical protein
MFKRFCYNCSQGAILQDRIEIEITMSLHFQAFNLNKKIKRKNNT